MSITRIKWNTSALAATLLAASVAAPAQTLTRSYGSNAGAVNGISIAALGSNQIITAMVNSTGNLELICWWNNPVSHSLTRQGTYIAGTVVASPTLIQSNGTGAFNVQEVALAAINQSQFVTAVRDTGGFLELIVFDVNSTQGQIIREGTAYTDSMPYFSQIGSLALTDLDGQRVVAVTADPIGSTSTVSTWSVDSYGDISEQAYPWTLGTEGGAVAIAAVNTSQIVVGQTGGCPSYPGYAGTPCYYSTGGAKPLSLTSFAVSSSGYLTPIQQVFPAGMTGSAQDLSFNMTNLGGGNFAIAFINNYYESIGWGVGGYMSVSMWQDSNGYLAPEATGMNYYGDTVAVADVAGIAFTISDNDEWSYAYNGGYYASPEAFAWYGVKGAYYNVVANSVDTQFSCTSPNNNFPLTPCTASAASLPTGQAASAVSDSSGNLHVDIWTFTGPY